MDNEGCVGWTVDSGGNAAGVRTRYNTRGEVMGWAANDGILTVIGEGAVDIFRIGFTNDKCEKEDTFQELRRHGIQKSRTTPL